MAYYYSVARRYGDASQHPSSYWTVTYHLILLASVSASGVPVFSSYVGFATSGAACDAIVRGDGGEGRRPRALDHDENGLGSRACSSSGMG